MLTSLTQLLNKEIHLFHSAETQKKLHLFENVDKHNSVLHFRNAQLRSAILSGEEEKVIKRYEQFLKVLRSYIHLIVTELHGKICQAEHVEKSNKYMAIRTETFSGYEEILKLCNRTTEEMMKMGEEYTRELFKVEMQLKRYHLIEKQSLFPLYDEACGRHL